MTSHSSSGANVVGVHYRVGKKIGEGSFGVIFEGTCNAVHLWLHRKFNCHRSNYSTGTNLLNSQTVAIKFVRWSRKSAAVRLLNHHFPPDIGTSQGRGASTAG